MADFLLNVRLPLGLVLSFLALVHCGWQRKGVAWFLIIVLLGPLGGLLYLACYMGWITFSKLPSPSIAATSIRRCPRCQQPAPMLYEIVDGRATLHLCQMCKSEMELRRSDFSPSDLTGL